MINFFGAGRNRELLKNAKPDDLIVIGYYTPNKSGAGTQPEVRAIKVSDFLANISPLPESPLPELKEVVTYVTAEQLRGEDPLWLGTNITNLTDSENNYPSDIDVLIEYTWDHADFDLNGTQAILGTGSGTVIQLPETFFTQNYGGVYGTRLFIGPSGRPEYVGVGADTNIYFRILPTPSWLNGNGSLRIITTYRERTYGN